MVTDGRRTAKLAGDPPSYTVSSEDATKLFVSDERFAIATYGEAEIGARSIEQVIEEFAGPTGASCKQYAEALGGYVAELMSQVKRPVRGDFVRADSIEWKVSFMVAVQEEDRGRAFEVKVRAGKFAVEPRLDTTDPGVYPFGHTDGIDRLLNGIDRDAFKAARLEVAGGTKSLELLRYDLIYPETLAASVEFAAGLIDVQLLAQRFSRGAIASGSSRVNACGGRIRALTVGAGAVEWHLEDAA
jgi:hypothetical protein